MTDTAKESPAPKGEHIFPATIVEPLAIKWKELMAQNRQAEASEVLEEIVRQSTQMFTRFAQYEGYHHTVELESLVLAAQARIPTWLIYWDPNKGRLFSWITKCAKNVFLHEVVHESNHHKRYFATSDTLEKFSGAEDPAALTNEAAESVRETLKQLTCRWADEQALCCIRYHVACIVENPRKNKKTAIRAGAYASGLSYDLSKFYYNWALVALREAMYDKMSLPYTEQDLFRLTNSYTYLPDMLNVISWQDMLKLCAIFGGLRVKFPTLAQIAQRKKDEKIFRQLDKSRLDPESVNHVAKENHVSTATAQEIYERMAVELDDRRSCETSLYD